MEHSNFPVKAQETAAPHNPEPCDVDGKQLTEVGNSSTGRKANALTHGLTAKKTIPAILQPGRLLALLEGLRHELQPKTLIDELLVREIARHAAMLEVSEAAEWAVLRQGANGLAKILSVNVADQNDDLVLAAAVTTEPLERLTRYRRAHEKALYQAIHKVYEQRPVLATDGLQEIDSHMDLFATDEACRSHLRARFDRADWRCPGCDGSRGHWVDTRDCWECAVCGRQVGLRYGTVFERSPLPLVTWFLAIRVVVSDATITAATLGQLISIRRPATAQSMLARIRHAMEADDSGTQLAGLTAYL
jgi:hypothetical protein